MMRTAQKTGALVAGLLVVAALTLPVFAVADSASVTVSFRVTPTVSAEVVEGGLFVRSNAPWRLVAKTAGPDGSTVTLSDSGPATGAAGVLIEADSLIEYSLVIDTGR